jgi:uncharacterized SAM-binding protein YcdF (DUF218 family)
MLLVTATPVVRWWAKALSGPFNDPTGDTLIVLGSDTLDYGTVGGSSYWRSVYGMRAYRSGKFHRVLISGGPDIPGAAASDAIAGFLACEDVPKSSMLLERRSTNTRENAIFSAELLRDVPGTKVLLTSDYHMYRAYRAFRKAGLDVIPRPFPDAIKRDANWRSRWPAFLDLLTETSKIVYYRAHGWI